MYIGWSTNRYKGDQPLEPSDRIKIETKDVRQEKAGILVITKATPDDQDTYHVVAKNPAGEAKCSAKLTVQSMYCKIM